MTTVVLPKVVVPALVNEELCTVTFHIIQPDVSCPITKPERELGGRGREGEGREDEREGGREGEGREGGEKEGGDEGEKRGRDVTVCDRTPHM